MSNNEVLRSLMSQYSLKESAVADLLTNDYGITSVSAVNAWRYNGRNMPGTTLELLVLKLKYEIVD